MKDIKVMNTSNDYNIIGRIVCRYQNTCWLKCSNIFLKCLKVSLSLSDKTVASVEINAGIFSTGILRFRVVSAIHVVTFKWIILKWFSNLITALFKINILWDSVLRLFKKSFTNSLNNMKINGEIWPWSYSILI